MENTHKTANWLVFVLFVLLAGITFWSVSLLIRNSRENSPIDGSKHNNSQQLITPSGSTELFETLVVGGDESNPPYSFLEDGQALGYYNDLMRAIAQKLNKRIEFRLSPVSKVEQNLLDGSIDVINGLVMQPQRDGNDYVVTDPIATVDYDLFTRRDASVHDLADLRSSSLVIVANDPIVNYLDNVRFPGRIITADTTLEALTWLASGKYDGALIGRFEGYYQLQNHHLAGIKGTGKNIQISDSVIAIGDNEADLKAQINQALSELKSDGTMDDISDEWFTNFQQVSFFDKNEYLIYGIVLLITFILIILLWGWSMRRQVRIKTDELRSSEKKYRQLINSATEGVAIIVDRKMTYLNPQAQSILGIESPPDQPPNLLDFVHPFDHELVLLRYQQLMDDLQTKAQLRFRCLTTKGLSKWLRANPVKIEWEGKTAILVFFTDITEERKLEEAIKSSEEQYRLMFAQSPVGMFYFDADLHITNVNDHFISTMNSDRAQLQGFDLQRIENKRFIEALKVVITNHENGYYEGRLKPFFSQTQPDLFVKLRTTPMQNEKMEFQGGIGLIEDITEQIKNEHKIKNLKDNFSKVFFTSPDAICIARLGDGVYIDANRGFFELTGYTREELIGKSPKETDLWVNKDDLEIWKKGLLSNGEYRNLETQFRNKNGIIHTGLVSSSIIDVEGTVCVLSITRDIDELKRTNELIKKSEQRYRTIFESVPVSIWEQDMTGIYDLFEELRSKGVEDLQEYMCLHPQFIETALCSIVVKDVNDISLKFYKAKSKEQLKTSLINLFNDESINNFEREMLAIWNQESFFNGDSANLDMEGKQISINLALQIPKTREEFQGVLVSVTDITERKKAEEALLESESRYRQLVEQINVVVYLDYAEIPSRAKYISPQIESLLGYTQEEWLANPDLLTGVIHPDDLPEVNERDIETDKTGEPFVVEYRAFTRDGRMIWVHDEAVLVYDANGKPDDWHGVMYDITDRKRAEDALRDSEIRYRTIFNSVPVSIKQEDFSALYLMMEELRATGVVDLSDYIAVHPEWVKKAVESVIITEVNEETLRIYKADSKEKLLNSLTSSFSEGSYSSFEKELLAFWEHQPVFEQETVNKTLTGEEINVWISITIPPNPADYSKILVTIMDITERKRTEEQIRLQVRYLAALRAVDMAISASMDLPITLRVLLNQVHQQLGSDAVSILILDPHTQTLRFAAGTGFQSGAIESTNLRLGQSYAGQAALERRVISADNLAMKGSMLTTKDLEKEEFSYYIGVPLVSKGTVKGVLELFNHKPFEQDSAWMSLLESMAGQAAIAIENATLMDEVQKVNVNLRSAYDATIEGWGRSLDFRNGDLDGHSRRVADLTIELAQTAGFQGEGLLDLRRGALLHDIGKLGIPDSILMKPEPLSDEEMGIIKTHPDTAKRLLTSIDFLKSAVDIPYAHHEHWDGTGYPEGLVGDAIPFGARVFAVVDCWDVLRSDRPWRKAWTDENAWDFIEKNAGKLFDPHIVECFRQLLGHGFSSYF